jgi:hypothetical protein
MQLAQTVSMHVQIVNRDELMKAREMEGQIGTVAERRVKLLAILNTYPTEEVAAALNQAKSELTALKEQKAAVDQAAVQRINLSRSQEALLAKIDLTGNTARVEATTCFGGLGSASRLNDKTRKSSTPSSRTATGYCWAVKLVTLRQ